MRHHRTHHQTTLRDSVRLELMSMRRQSQIERLAKCREKKERA